VCGSSSGLNVRCSRSGALPALAAVRRSSEPQIEDGQRGILSVVARGSQGLGNRSVRRAARGGRSENQAPKQTSPKQTTEHQLEVPLDAPRGSAGFVVQPSPNRNMQPAGDVFSSHQVAQMAQQQNLQMQMQIQMQQQRTQMQMAQGPGLQLTPEQQILMVQQQQMMLMQQMQMAQQEPQTTSPTATTPVTLSVPGFSGGVASSVDSTSSVGTTLSLGGSVPGAKPTAMKRAKNWTPEVENYFRFQAAGFRDMGDYLHLNPQPEYWDTGFVRMLLNKKTGFYMYFRRQRECNDAALHRIKIYSYEV